MRTLIIYLFLTGVHPTSVHLIGGCLSHVHISLRRLPHGTCISWGCTSRPCILRACISWRYTSRVGMCLMGVYLIGVYLTCVHLIILFRGCTTTGDIAGSCLLGAGLSG